jgi:hypothetical protein
MGKTLSRYVDAKHGHGLLPKLENIRADIGMEPRR